MSAKRMFNLSVVNSDSFLLDLELSAQAFYFHLAMRADDDGFVENPRTIRRMTGASESDYKALIDRGYVIAFEGPAVICHWFLHNTIKQDRYKPTIFQDELRTLKIIDGVYKPRDPEEIQDQAEGKEGNQDAPEALEHPEEKQKAANREENQAGTKNLAPEGKEDPEGGKSAFFKGAASGGQSGSGMVPEWKQGGTVTDPQVSIDKSRIDKDRIEREEGKSSSVLDTVEGKDKARAREIVDNSVDNSVDNFRKASAKPRFDDLPPEAREKVLSFNRRLEEMKRGVG